MDNIAQVVLPPLLSLILPSTQDWLHTLETSVYSHYRPRPSPHLTAASALGPPSLPLQKLLFSATLSQVDLFLLLILFVGPYCTNPSRLL